MSDKYMIHETVIRDIVDIMMDLKDTDEIEMMLGKKRSFKSTTSAAENMTLVFPVVCSRSVSIENASMVVKAIERKAATMLQMLFSAYMITDKDNAIDFIRQFHTNVNFSSSNVTVGGIIDTLDKIANMEESGIECIDPQTVQTIKEQLRDLTMCLPDSVNESSLADYNLYPSNGYREEMVLKEAPAVRMNRGKNPPAVDVADYMSNTSKYASQQMLNTDVKKANELMPTMMIVNFIYTGGNDGEAISAGNVIVGVKAKLYPVDSQDLINHIKTKVADNNWLNSLVRASTREISFWKDFVFALDKAKIDALSGSRKGSTGSKMWKVLERRALKSRIHRSTNTMNDALAITTLVMTKEEVEYVKKFETVNVEDPRVARILMDSYNLMGITVVDESLEVCNFIFDTGDDTYETVAFGLLEREAADNSYKKIVNLMTKVSR